MKNYNIYYNQEEVLVWKVKVKRKIKEEGEEEVEEGEEEEIEAVKL